jgi:uncharacterized protein
VRHYFLDTSALVKLYALEKGSTRVQAAVRAATHGTQVFVCDLVHPETASALYQAAHGPNPARRGLSRASARFALGKLKQDLAPGSSIVVIGATGLMENAADLAWKHGIRGADAVHLAAALFARRMATPYGDFHLVSSDRALNAAAAAEGLEVYDPAV